jgi:hypothetical protein
MKVMSNFLGNLWAQEENRVSWDQNFLVWFSTMPEGVHTGLQAALW